MEYERALFRVYDRSLDSLRMDEPCDARRCGPRVKPTTVCAAIEVVLVVLVALCFVLLGVAHTNFVGESAPPCLKSELQFLRDRTAAAWVPEDHPNKTVPDFELLGKNDILQLRVGTEHGTRERTEALDAQFGFDNRTLYGAGDGDFKPDYRFTRNAPLLFLSKPFVKNHDVTVWNVSVPQGCLTRGGTGALGAVTTLLGYDTIVINQLFDAVREGGLLENSRTKEQWGWSAALLPPRGGRAFGAALAFKTGVVFDTACAFFFTATVTALVVRMLISSGVVVMFPLFALMQALGFRELDMHILTLSYPWLGLPVELLRRQRKPSGPLIGAHCVRVVVLYSMYEACQIAWSLWLYDKPMPDGLQLEVFALIMIWEYFAMIYLRCAAAT